MLFVVCCLMLQCSWTGHCGTVSKGTGGSPILCHCLCSHWNFWLTLMLSSSSQAKPACNCWVKMSTLDPLLITVGDSYVVIYHTIQPFQIVLVKCGEQDQPFGCLDICSLECRLI